MNEVFGPGEHEDAVAHYHERGYTVLRGIHTRDELAALTRALARVEPRTLDYIQSELKRQGFVAAR